MLIDATALVPGSTLTGTVCVIGSGAAGTTAALELARRGVDVMLLEAGAERRTREYQATYEGEVASSGLDTGSMHPPLDSVRVRKLGGTTGAWGGRCAPLTRSTSNGATTSTKVAGPSHATRSSPTTEKLPPLVLRENTSSRARLRS